MWNCDFCQKKNSNNSRNCHTKSCLGKKPENIIKDQQKQKVVRDFCPKCQRHENFIQISKNKFKCPRCKRSFRMIGKPIKEKEKILKNNTVITLEN